MLRVPRTGVVSNQGALSPSQTAGPDIVQVWTATGSLLRGQLSPAAFIQGCSGGRQAEAPARRW